MASIPTFDEFKAAFEAAQASPGSWGILGPLHFSVSNWIGYGTAGSNHRGDGPVETFYQTFIELCEGAPGASVFHLAAYAYGHKIAEQSWPLEEVKDRYSEMKALREQSALEQRKQENAQADRLMISCFKGLAPVSFPKSWLENFDMEHAFAYEALEARILFNGAQPVRGFGVQVHGAGPNLSRQVHELSDEEIAETPWGEMCSPWESYGTAKLFGHGHVTKLDLL